MEPGLIVMLLREKSSEALTALYLHKKGYIVATVTEVAEVLEKVEEEKADIIIMDNELKEEGSLEACREIRKRTEIPVLFIGSREAVSEKVKALNAGGDDYITKPYDLTELEARIRAHLRRKEKKEPAKTRLVRAGSLEIRPETHQVFKNNEEISLYAKEFQLLLFLLQNKGRVFSADQIYEQIWGAEKYGDIKTVAVHIRNLRKKIEDNPKKPLYIETIRGFGYKFSQKM